MSLKLCTYKHVCIEVCIYIYIYMVVVGKHFTFLLIVVWWEIPTELLTFENKLLLP